MWIATLGLPLSIAKNRTNRADIGENRLISVHNRDLTSGGGSRTVPLSPSSIPLSPAPVTVPPSQIREQLKQLICVVLSARTLQFANTFCPITPFCFRGFWIGCGFWLGCVLSRRLLGLAGLLLLLGHQLLEFSLVRAPVMVGLLG